MNTLPKDIEKEAMALAGYFTTSWMETLQILMAIPSGGSLPRKMLEQMRDAELTKVDAMERQLGLTPTTAEIRKWYKEQHRR